MKLIYVFAASLLFFAKGSMAAYILSPSFVEISVDPKYNRPEVRSFYLDNKNKEAIALEIVVTKRIVNEDGSMDNLPVKDLDQIMSIYPKQFVVKPEERRTVRITYKGPKNLKAETNYRFAVRRIIVDQEKVNKNNKEKKSTLDLVIDLMGSIYIIPKDGKADIQVVKFEKTKGKKNDELNVTITNKGNIHLIVDNYSLNITYINSKNEESKIELKSQDIPKDGEYFMKSRTNVLPSAKRVITVPFKGLNVKEIKSVEIKTYKN